MEKPNIYERGKVYKIVCNTTGLTYVGSTTQALSQRLAQHNADFKGWKESKRGYTTSYKVIENGKFEIILIEDFPCERKEQLHARERYWIENTECINQIIPSRTLKEYREANKEYLVKKRAEDYQKNKEILLKKQAELNQKNKEKYKQNKAEYYKINREYLLKQKAEYYENNKETIAKRGAEYRKRKQGTKIDLDIK